VLVVHFTLEVFAPAIYFPSQR